MNEWPDQQLIREIARLSRLRADAQWKETAWQTIASRISRRPASLMWLKKAALAGTVAMLLIFGSGGLVASAQETVPGEWLYPVKRGSERVRLFVVRDPVERARLEVFYAERRVKEYEVLIDKENGQDRLTDNQQQAANGLDESVHRLDLEMTKIVDEPPSEPEESRTDAIEKLIQDVEARKARIRSLKSRVGGAKRNRLETVENGLDRVLEKARQAGQQQ